MEENQNIEAKEPLQNKSHSNLIDGLKKILNKNDAKTFVNQMKFARRKIEEKKFKTGSLRFAKLYSTKKTSTRYLLAILIGMVMSLFSTILIQSTGLYTGGFGAICQGIARITFAFMNKTSNAGRDFNDFQITSTSYIIYNLLFWGLYLTLNIPLIIFAYKKINKQFALLSIVFLIAMQGSGFMWNIIPGLGDFKIFGATDSIYPQLNNLKIQVNIFFPQWFPNMNNSDVFNWETLYRTSDSQWCSDVPWEEGERAAAQAWCKSFVTGENNTNALLLILYSSVYALISSVGYALVYILGGSTGGSDFITIYLSQEKNKSVGSVFMLVNAICMTIGITIGSYTSGCIINTKYFSGWEFFFSANLFISLLFIILNGMFMNRMFPWHKMTRVEIFSNKHEEINKLLKQVEYTHPTTVIKGVGGYSGKDTYVLTTICMTIELPSLVKAIRTVDEKCFLSAIPVSDADGMVTIQRQTF